MTTNILILEINLKKTHVSVIKRVRENLFEYYNIVKRIILVVSTKNFTYFS